MNRPVSRRQILIGGAVLLLSACGRQPAGSTRRTNDSVGRGGAPEPAPAGLWYVVVAGDTLNAIAQRGGITVAAIEAANRLPRAAVLSTGQRLFLPGATALAAAPAAPAAPVDDLGELANGRYELVPRSVWTNRPVSAKNQAMGTVKRITVHHTGEYGRMGVLPDMDVIQSVENAHRGRGYAAIGYHFVIGRDGRVYEGRPTRFQGAHTANNNSNNLGISCIGDFMQKLPGARQLKALELCLNDMRARYGVPMARVYGHRELSGSLCPGDRLFAWLKNTYRV